MQEFVRRKRPDEIVIVPDADEVGRDGAERLAEMLASAGQCVRVVGPPDRVKDAREWVQAGATKEEIVAAFQAVPLRKMSAVTRKKKAKAMNDEMVIELMDELPGGRATLTVMAGQKLLLADTVRMFKEQDRERFANAVCEGRPAIGVADVRARLLEITNGMTGGTDATEDTKKSQANLLVELAHDVELFHNPDGEAFATVPVADHFETYPLNGKSTRLWLSRRFWDQAKKAPGAQAMQEALGVLSAKALFEGAERAVSVRMAKDGESFWLDLCDSTWSAVEITSAGWHIVNNPPVKFVRKRGMLQLPSPERGGRMDDVRPLMNMADTDDWALLNAWLVGALRPGSAYPILAVNGEQGSAKSTLCRMLRTLIDPNTAPLRAEPREARDLMITANNNWMLAFDNLSLVPGWLSDAMCRLATGGGFATRELFSDGDEKIFYAARPMLINGIEDLANRSDLLDRCICVTLPNIPEERRRTEEDVWGQFESLRPRLLGALLDAVSAAMANVSKVKLSRKPRMADFAIWATAAEQALGLESGAVMAAYDRNRESSNDVALEAVAIGPAILNLMRSKEHFSGTAKDLLAALESDGVSDERMRRRKDWPSSPRAFAGALQRLAPNLRRCGIGVTIPTGRTNRGRQVTLERLSS